MNFREFSSIFLEFPSFSGGTRDFRRNVGFSVKATEKNKNRAFLVTYQGSLFRGSMSHNFAPQESSRVWKNTNFEGEI